MRLLFDTDMGFDDILALIYLCSLKSVKIDGVIISHGLCHPKPGWSTARGILDKFGLDSVPAFIGNTKPQSGGHDFPIDWRNSSDKLGLDIGLQSKATPKFLRRSCVSSFEKNSTVLICGASTSFAQTYGAQINPSSVNIMGGALSQNGNLHHPGSGIETSTAEWNFYSDPVSIKSTLSMGHSTTIITLDSCRNLPVTNDFINRLSQQKLNHYGQLVLEVLTHPSIKRGIDSFFCFWDLLAAVVATNLVPINKQLVKVDIVLGDELNKSKKLDPGTIIHSNGGHPVQEVLGVSRSVFEEHLISVWKKAE